MTRVFVTSDLLASCTQQIEQIKQDFLLYKSSDELPPYFGRDVTYSWPASAKAEELHHLHLAIQGHEWGRGKQQYSRTSDDHIVYTRGFNDQDCYLLIALMTPDAHNKANDIDLMEQYAKIAHKFRCQY